MYKHFLKPILFRVDAEKAHSLTARALRLAGKIPGGRIIMRWVFSHKNPRLEREVMGIRFPNPVGMAAGFDKNGSMCRELSALGFGFVEVGTVTPLPQPGNPRPRLFRLPKDNALINRMGFNSDGMESMVKNLRNRGDKTVIGVNLGKNSATPNEKSPADYLKLFRALYDYADYFVVNVSCPNVKDVTCLQNRESVMAILQPLFDFRHGQNTYRPILLKVSPDLEREDLDTMIDVMIETPLDGMVAVNTTTSRDGLSTDTGIVERIGNGGLSGAPLTERAIETVAYIHEKSGGQYPIIGVGGVMSPEDAVRMLRAGASLIQVYSGMIYEGPGFAKKICREIAETL